MKTFLSRRGLLAGASLSATGFALDCCSRDVAPTVAAPPVASSGIETNPTFPEAGSAGTGGTYTYLVAAFNSTTAEKARADRVCQGVNDQNTVNALMPFVASPPSATEGVNIFFFNGDYAIDAPIKVTSGCVLQGASEDGVRFHCRNGKAVFQASVPAIRHHLVTIDSFTIFAGAAGTNDVLACDFRGFTRSQFNRLHIYHFTTGVWFGGDLPAYDSCWTNVLSRFYLDECLVGVKLSGTTAGGVPTANNITLTEGEIICRDAPGGVAVDAIDAEVLVEKTDIGYGYASAGIVIGANANHSRVVDSRFEWDFQSPQVYPIAIAANSYYHYFAGNTFNGKCSEPHIFDANIDATNGVGGRYLQLNDCQRNTLPLFPGGPTFPDGFIDVNIDTYFRRSPTFAQGVFIQADATSALAAATQTGVPVFDVNTIKQQVSVLNGGTVNLFSDQRSTSMIHLDGSIGRLTLAGEIVTTGNAPTATAAAAAGTGKSAGLTGTNTAGIVTLTTGTNPTPGKVFDIAWSAPKPSANYAVIVTAANANAATALSRIYVDHAAATTTATSITASVALAASTAYTFYYQVLSF